MNKILSSLLIVFIFLTFSLFTFFASHANALTTYTQVKIYKLKENNVKESIGIVNIEENSHGLIFTPDLLSLPEGLHGFHVHMNPSCDTKDGVIGAAAGGHYDPQDTNKHLGPYNVNGHFGDLPALYVDDKGRSTMSVLAPRIKKLSEIKGRSLIIHIHGDNQSDVPLPLGGGGARLACGIIE
ncbi:superoxide dismutase [Cu-Zn] SodC [Bartonella sp. B41]